MGFGFLHVHIKAKDPRKSAQWWVDMFGATPHKELNLGGAIVVPIDLDKVYIMLSNPRPEEAERMGSGDANIHYGIEHVALRTDDIEAALAKFKEQGLRIFERGGAGGSKSAFVEGPDNVRIELIQPAPKA
ncbi:MAG: VOC family protein [Chloroflexota bacterium]|nr:VOC family protein [Chloroflexota bacterium]